MRARETNCSGIARRVIRVLATVLASSSALVFTPLSYAAPPECEVLLEVAPQPDGAAAGKTPAEIKRLVDNHYKLMLWIIGKFAFRAQKVGLDDGDLVSEGHMSLMKAAEKYKEGYGAKFSTYAYRVITRDMLNLINQTARKALRNESLDAKRGKNDEDDGFSLLSVWTDPEWQLNGADRLLENRQRDAAFALRVFRFKKRLAREERIIFENGFVTPDGGAIKNGAQIGELLGVSRQRVDQIAQRLKPRIKAYFARKPTDGPMSAMRNSLSYFKEGLSRDELLILEQRLAAEEPESLEKVAASLNLLPVAVRAMENRLLARALVYEQALEIFERGLNRGDRTILHEQVLFSDKPSMNSTAEKAERTWRQVRQRALELKKSTSVFLPVLIDLVSHGQEIGAVAVQARLAGRGHELSLREVGEQLGMNPYLEFPNAVEFYRQRLTPKLLVVFNEALLASRPKTQAAIARLSGYSLASIERHLPVLREDFERYAPALEQLLAQGARVTPQAVLKALADRGDKGLTVEEVSRGILHNPYEGYEKAIEIIRSGLNHQELAILDEYLLAQKATVADLAARFKKNSSAMKAAIGYFRQELDVILPALQGLIEQDVDPVPENVQKALAEKGIHRPVDEVAAQLGVSHRARYRRAVEYYRSRLSAKARIVFDEGVVAARPKAYPALAKVSGYSQARVAEIVRELRDDFDLYAPVLEELLAESAEVSPEAVLQRLAARGNTGLERETVARAILYRPYERMEKAVEFFKKGRTPEELALLDDYILTRKTTMVELGKRFKKTQGAINGAIVHLNEKMAQYLPVFQELLDRGIEPTIETVAEALRGRGIDKSPADLRRSLNLGQRSRWLDYPEGIRYFREQASVKEREMLDLEILAEHPLGRDKMADRLGVGRTNGYGDLRQRIEAWLERYAELLEKFARQGTAINAANVHEELARRNTPVDLFTIGAELKLNPLGGFERGVEYYLARLGRRHRDLLEKGLLDGVPRTNPELARVTGLALPYLSHAIAPFRDWMAQYVPVVHRLLEEGVEVNVENVIEELRRSGVDVTTLATDEVSERIFYNSYQQYGAALTAFRNHLRRHELVILEERLLSRQSSSVELAEKLNTTKRVVERTQAELKARLDLFLPAFKALLSQGKAITPENLHGALGATGTEMSVDEIRQVLRFGDKTKYAGNEQAIAVIRQGLSPIFNAVLEERMLAEVITKREDFAEKHGVTPAYVSQAEDRLEKKIGIYAPALNLLLSEGKELSSENISEALLKTSGYRRSARQVRSELGLKEPNPILAFAAPEYRAAVEVFASLLDEGRRVLLSDRLLTASPRSLGELAQRLGTTKSNVQHLEGRLSDLTMTAIPLIAKLQAAGKEVSIENLSEALTAAGHKYFSPKELGRRLGQ